MHFGVEVFVTVDIKRRALQYLKAVGLQAGISTNMLKHTALHHERLHEIKPSSSIHVLHLR